MKVVLNLAMEPFLVSLWSRRPKPSPVIHRIQSLRKSGEEVFEFFANHNLAGEKIEFLGGVSGPGGFSNLRVGAAILNALAFAHHLPVHQVRADIWVRSFLEEKEKDPESFVLNSFGQNIYYPRGKNLIHCTINEAVQHFGTTPVWVESLPAEKKDQFSHRVEEQFKDPEISLLSALEKTEPREIFLPEYEFPAVEG